MAAGAREHGVRDQVDRVGRTRVLGLLVGVVVGHPRAHVVNDILEDGPEAFDRGEDLGLGLADSVVLPVPLRPKNMATSPPSSSTLAEQCIGKTPLAGSK